MVWFGHTPPTHPLSIFLNYEIFGNMKQHKKIIIKKNPTWGLNHPPTSEFFSFFFIFTIDKAPYHAYALIHTFSIKNFMIHFLTSRSDFSHNFIPLFHTVRLDMTSTINPFEPKFVIVIFIHYKPRIAVAILDL